MFAFPHRVKLSKSTELAIIYFIIGIGLAALDTVWALYFNNFGLSESTIGFISAGTVALCLIFSFFSTPIMQKYDKIKIIILSLISNIVCYVLIFIYHNVILFVILSIIISIAYVFRINSYDIIFRDNTETKNLNKQEGLYYSLMNLSWLIGPLIGGFVLLKFNIQSVFLFAAISTTLSLIIFMSLKLKPIDKKIKTYDINLIKNIKDYFKDKKRIYPYLMSSGIYAWFALIYIYVPLFILNKGVSEYYFGIFFAAVCIPPLISEYVVGKLSEKYGFKSFFILGYLGLFLSCIALFFINNVFVQIGILVFAGFFVACLEPLQDSFFFKMTYKYEEEKYYPVYATATHIGNFLSKILIAGILLFFADNYAYLGISILFFCLALIATKIPNQKLKLTYE